MSSDSSRCPVGARLSHTRRYSPLLRPRLHPQHQRRSSLSVAGVRSLRPDRQANDAGPPLILGRREGRSQVAVPSDRSSARGQWTGRGPGVVWRDGRGDGRLLVHVEHSACDSVPTR